MVARTYTFVIRTSLVLIALMIIEIQARKPAHRCLLPQVVGRCSGQQKRARVKYFFDTTDFQCKQFTYSGCNGNRNRFQTLNKCEKNCKQDVQCPEFRCHLNCRKFELKPNGCRRCRCKDSSMNLPIPVGISCPRCSNLCLDGFSDCDDCLCKGCSRNRCRLGCPTGFMEDERGCKMCACRQKVPKTCNSDLQCPFMCRYGRLNDNNGCQTCSCKNNPDNNMCNEDLRCPGLRCGERHLKTNREGCQICQCEKFQSKHKSRTGNRDQERMCAMPMCTARCAYGLATTNGCPSCDCNPPPDKPMCGILNTCNIRCMALKRNSRGCEICQCENTPTIMRDPVPDPCPVFQCPLACSGNYYVDDNGCKECRCLGDYDASIECEMKTCEIGQCEPDMRHDLRGCPICLCDNGMDPVPTSVTIHGAACDRQEDDCGDLRCGDQGFAYDSRGCRICECAPPIRGTSRVCHESKCTKHCTGGYLYDDRGCMTCQCKIVKSSPTVRGHCEYQGCSEPCEFGREVDNRGCEICICRYEPVCPSIDLSCQLNCPDGLAMDQNECPVCACKCPRQTCRMGCKNGFAVDPVTMCELCACAGEPDECPANFVKTEVCSSYCDTGYAKDKRGCDTCVCHTLEHFRQCTRFESHCTNPCEYGYVRDTQGCRTCVCNLVPNKVTETLACPETMCTLYCHAGFIKDSRGCDVCQCRKRSCDQECSPGKTCSYGFVLDLQGCSTCECKREPCPEISCRKNCEHGMHKNERGCDICRCKSKPVTDEGKICRKAEPKCDNYCKLYVIDSEGCKMCECKSGMLEDEIPLDLLNAYRKKTKCKSSEMHCENFCEEYTYDVNNCRTCECYQPISLKEDGKVDDEKICGGAMPMCYNYCQEYEYNENNCMTCSCVSGRAEDVIPAKISNYRRQLKQCKGAEPECSTVCEDYLYDQDNCNTCTCFSEQSETPTKAEVAYCPRAQPMCDNYCKEYFTDSEGCATCRCTSGLSEDEKADDIADPSCTKLEPMCSNYCRDYVYDDENCMTCDCESGRSEDPRPDDIGATPQVKCNRRGEDCYKYCANYMLDSDGCEICACAITTTPEVSTGEIVCKRPAPMCHNYCKKYARDLDNCLTCQCVPNVPGDKVCPLVECDFDCNLVKDANGCDMCVCSDQAIPDTDATTTKKCVDPRCSNTCARYELDARGCKMCVCSRQTVENPALLREKQCPDYRTVCDQECPGGYVRYSNDCITCQCLSDNGEKRKLPTTSPTTPEPTTRQGMVCPRLRNCWKLCLTGRMRDEDGCSLCQCNPISSEKKRHSMCYLRKKVGPCRMMKPRWYFNKENGVCTQFRYGGCKANLNNFLSESSCKSYCRLRQSITSWFAHHFQL